MFSFPIRIAVVLGATLLCAVQPAAQAQTHLGNGQALRVRASVVNLVGVEVASSVAGPQPIPGANFAVGPEVRVGSVSTLGLNAPALVSGVSNFLNVNASALAATSNGGGDQVFSTATIGAIGASNPVTNLTLGLSVPAAGLFQPNVDLSNFLTLTALRTETFGNINELRTSRTIIEGLAIRNGNGTLIDIASSAAGSGATVSTNLDGTVNLEFDDSDSTVGITVSGVGQGDIAEILLHEKLDNLDSSRTTNGIHVDLLDAGLTGALADVDVVLASSTAGVAAPEPGSLSLLALALGGGIATRTRRRGKGKGIMHSKRKEC